MQLSHTTLQQQLLPRTVATVNKVNSPCSVGPWGQQAAHFVLCCVSTTACTLRGLKGVELAAERLLCCCQLRAQLRQLAAPLQLL